MWQVAIALVTLAPLAFCGWMLWVVYGGGRKPKKKLAATAALSGHGAPSQELETYVLAELEQVIDPGVELALRGRAQASRLLPAGQRQLLLIEIGMDLDRYAQTNPRARAEAQRAEAQHAAPLELLQLSEAMRDAFVASRILAALEARLATVLGRGPAEQALLKAGALPGDLEAWREFLDSGNLREFVERLLQTSRGTLGAERMLALLESAARDVGTKLPLACFPRLLAAFPEEFLIAERSYAASRQALWNEFLATRRKLDEAQEQLSRTHALAALTELSASMAHEINNPLASVLAVVEMLHADAPEGSRERRLLAAAESEARRIHRITRQLHELGTREAWSDCVAPVGEVVHAAVGLVDRQAQAASVRIERQLDSVPPLAADGRRVRDALVHVMSGAVASMESGGTLTVSARREDGGVTVMIQDTGPGVPDEVLARLHEPNGFEDVVEPWKNGASKNGRWMGLKAAHAIACSYHGELRIDNERGRGSTFTFRFPAASLEHTKACQ